MLQTLKILKGIDRVDAEGRSVLERRGPERTEEPTASEKRTLEQE
jgi:hypothetical protein